MECDALSSNALETHEKLSDVVGDESNEIVNQSEIINDSSDTSKDAAQETIENETSVTMEEVAIEEAVPIVYEDVVPSTLSDTSDSSQTEDSSEDSSGLTSDDSDTDDSDVSVTDAAFENRLGLCNVCGENSAKYTCPRCEMKTCCLECSKKHKTDTKCSGERDKTAFKRISEFTNLDLLSDYRMLEETTRSVENYVRDPLKHFTRVNRPLPVHLHRLYVAVSNRGSSLYFLPQHFSRHKSNTTFFNWKTQKIQWRIEWLFPQASCVIGIDERADEDNRMSTLVNKYLNPETCPAELQDHLQFYQSTGLSGITLLLKAERIKKSSSTFFELDMNLSLKNALKDKCIVEYPIIYVVLNAHRNMFDIIDPEEEQELTQNMDGNFRERRNFDSRRNSHQRKRPNNFLFNGSDVSDDSDNENRSKRRYKRNNNHSKINHKEQEPPSFDIPNYDVLIHQNN